MTEEQIAAWVFQSTLPAWGATLLASASLSRSTYFNPRSPRGERLGFGDANRRAFRISIHAPRVGSDCACRCVVLASVSISIHAPRVGSDSGASRMSPVSFVFQSTLPAWGATAELRESCPKLRISIHAPRVGSDSPRSSAASTMCDFNPRSPRGERPSSDVLWVRGGQISIHAPRVGSDAGQLSIGQEVGAFQSTLPAWGATPL